jgi:hypothetical protein
MVNLLPNEQFLPVLEKIQQARQKAYSQINATLVELYWNIGQYVAQQVNHAGWGKSMVETLADYIKHREPGIKGFSARNIWSMKQFYELYQYPTKLPTVWAELSWSHHRRIASCPLKLPKNVNSICNCAPSTATVSRN